MALLKSLGSRFGGRAGLADMLLGGGLGLMSQGPSLTPQSPWQGLGAGLMMGRQLSRGRQEQEREEARMALEREKFTAQQAGTAATAAQQQAQQSAMVDALVRSGMDPAQAQSIATAGAGASYLKPQAPPAAVQTAQWLQNQATPEERAALLELKRAGATNVNLGQGMKAETDVGKTMNDLLRLQDQPASPERDATEAALRAKLAKQGSPTGEMAEREGKFQDTLSAAEAFTKLAEKNEALVGPIEGRARRLQAGLGFGDETMGEMLSLEATMKSRLGTALSGAAIPETEWPTYQAQLPSMSDSPAIRKGKLKTLRQQIKELEARAATRRGETPAEEATTSPLPPAGVIKWSDLP